LKVIHWDPKTEVRLQLWDIAGQERFGNMTRVYYREAVGAFVVFDIQRLSTFEAVAQWKADIDAKVTWGPDNKPIPVVLLANKCDLAKEAFCKTPQEMDAYCQEHGFIGWYETSAKDNKGIDVAAKALVGYILEHDDRRAPEKDPGVIRPVAETVPKGKEPAAGSGGCCH
jgi:small GTP-binding protein